MLLLIDSNLARLSNGGVFENETTKVTKDKSSCGKRKGFQFRPLPRINPPFIGHQLVPAIEMFAFSDLSLR